MADDAAELLLGPRQKTRHILQGHEREVERVTETDEVGAFHGGIDVERAGEMGRLIRHDADRLPTEAGEPDDKIARKVLVNLEERAVVRDCVNEIENVVWLIRLFRHKLVEPGVLAVDGVGALRAGRVVEIVT